MPALPRRSLKEVEMLFAMTFLITLLTSSISAYCAVFNIASDDVQGLIAAINAANANGEENTINLEPGTYTLTAVDNGVAELATGVPVITSVMTITGVGAESTMLERDSSVPAFRILRIGLTGRVTIVGVTVSGGLTSFEVGGAGIWNSGDLIINRSIIKDNDNGPFPFSGGTILNDGTLTVMRSTVTRNTGDGTGGILNCGTATIVKSTITFNQVSVGGIYNGAPSCSAGVTATMTLMNSTVAKNRGSFGVGGIANTGHLTIKNSTIANNSTLPNGAVGGLLNTSSGTLELQNTIVAHNLGFGGAPDCLGEIISLGNNLIGEPARCDIGLLASDATGDPGLGDFIDSGASGNGRFRLLETSQAIDRGSNDACSSDPALATDQLGQSRSIAATVDGPGICDIGAIEFFPIVNNLVELREGGLVTEFDPRPSSGAPAGTLVITATFKNISTETIFFPFFEVSTLELQRTVDIPAGLKCSVAPAEDQPVLLNADGGPGHAQCQDFIEPERVGGAGARLTPADTLTIPFEPGATRTFQFRIGLQKLEPFTFLVNMLGERRTSNVLANALE
jgi:hypothetical protein